MVESEEKRYPRLDVHRAKGGARWGSNQMIWRIRQINWPDDRGIVVFESRTFEDAREHVVYAVDPKAFYPIIPR